MNICIVNIRENNPLIGGVEKVSFQLGHYWLEHGHRVIFLSRYRSGLAEGYESGCEEYFLPDGDVADTPVNVEYAVELLRSHEIEYVVNQGSVFEDLCRLCYNVKQCLPIRLVTAIHYDPLYKIAANESIFFINERLGVDAIKWMVDTALFLKFHLLGKHMIRKSVGNELRGIAGYSDAVVCLSESFLPEVRTLIGEGVSARLVAIPNPVVPTVYPQGVAKKKQIIYVGRLELGLKRVDRLVKIWAKTEAKFPDWRFHIVGDGDMRYLLEKMVREKGLKNIFFDGFQDPLKYYAESSILCLSSSSEGFGMVLVEALMQRCIPVAYNSFASLTDIIEDGINGFCIPAFDEDKYLQRLHKLMEDDNERSRIMANHKLTLSKFDIETVSDKWLRLFGELS